MITPSEFPWEQEALDFIRARLPDQDPFRAWSNFEFIAEDGSINEADLLVLTPAGFFLVEIKSRAGHLDGDAHTWTWREGDRVRSEDNPLILANRKAKKLASLLRAQPAFRAIRPPYLEPLVFCSEPGLVCRLQGAAGQRVCLREAVGSAGGQPGIIEALTRPGVVRGPGEAGAGRLDLPLVRALSRALEQAGIRPSQRSRRVGDYELGALLFQGPGYQDWEATHVALKGVRRRVRLYSVAPGAGAAARGTIRAAAEREFRILEGIQHAGILRAVDYTEHERGPALIFEHDPKAMRLDHYLIEHGTRLSVDVRLSLLRQIAEAVRYAHEKKLIHRALSPQSILVVDPTSALPRVQIFNWQTGARDAGSSSTGRGVSGTSHLGQLVEDATTVYLAPEALSDGGAAGESLDVFSLGALAYHLFAGQPPAATYFELAQKVREGKGLRIAAVLNGAGRELQDLIQFSTHPEVTSRLESASEFLTLLENVEQELTEPVPDGVEEPTDAKVGDRLLGGFVVKKRLGTGSCAVVLLVDRDGEEVVIKIATEPAHNDRLRGEAEVLRKLRHQNIVELRDVIELNGRAGLLMRKAGDRTLAQRLRTEGRLHLDLLQRFGEDLIQTVDWLEQQGLSHRDIKPDNIGVTPVGRGDRLHLVLFDFSLARTSAENIRAGTVPYLDPFLSLRRPPRWDLHAERFAVAMTLYEMATGSLPRWGDGKSDPAVLDCEVTLEPELFDPNLREGLAGFFAKALRREYRERFDNCEEMLRTWRKAFEGVDRPVPGTDHEGLVDRDARLREATLDTPVALLGLSTRAVNALDRRNIITVRDLLAAPVVEIYRMPGVGHKTRREIGEAVQWLAGRFKDLTLPMSRAAGPAATGAGTGEPEPEALSVDLLARRLIPAKSGKASSEEHVLRLLLGLGEGLPSAPTVWPSQTDVAGYLELTRPRIGQILAAARQRWSRDPSITRLRQDIADILDANGGVMVATELSGAILTARGSAQPEPLRSEVARAVTRAAVECERALAEPRFLVRRSGGVVLVSRSQELADYAERLADVTDRLAGEDPTASPTRVLEALQRVAPPPGMAPMTPERLVRLASSASTRAAVSGRLEVYPRGMQARRALKLAHGALLGAHELTVERILERVAARYPEAEPLPGRPELDGLLREAGWDFEWVHRGAAGEGVYRIRHRVGALVTSGSSSRLGRVTSDETGAVEVTPEVGDARGFEERLQHAVRHGAFLALTVEPRHLSHAERELTRRFPVERRSLEETLVRHVREAADRARADWSVVLRADGAARDSRDWQNLLMLVRRAVTGVEEELRTAAQAAGRTLLLLYPGLLARYGQLDVLQRLRDRIGRPAGIPGLWVLIPSDAQHEAPVMDGTPVPVITRGEWARIPEAWLRNLHRAGRRDANSTTGEAVRSLAGRTAGEAPGTPGIRP